MLWHELRHNASMCNNKKVFAMNRKNLFLLLLLSASYVCQAQNKPGIVSNLPTGLKTNLPFEISPKGGMAMPSAGLKNASFLNNGWLGGLDISLPVIRPKKNPKSFNFNLGFDAGIDYSSFTSNGGLDFVKNNYQLSNGSLNPYFDNSSNQAKALQISIGPRISLSYKKIHLTPSLQLGYFNFRQNGYSILDTVSNAAGVQSTIPLLFAKETNTNGLLIRPKINIGFDVTRYMRIWVGSSMSMGPDINNDYHIWQPDKKTLNNSISTDELIGGRAVLQRTNTPFQLFNIELGVKMGLGITPLSKPGIKFPQSMPPLSKSAYKDNVITAADKIKKNSTTTATQKTKQANANGALSSDNAMARYNASAPEIVFPANNTKTSLINNDLRINFKGSNTDNVQYELNIWTEKNGRKKNVLQQTYPYDWDGSVKDFGNIIDKKGKDIFHAQITAIPGSKDDKIKPKNNNTDYRNVQQEGTPVFTNRGISAPVVFSISAGCFPNLTLDLDSTKCVDSGKTKVWGHVTLASVTGITVTSITITDFRENNFSGLAVPVSNLLPGTSLPPTSNSPFSFNVDKDMCGKLLFMRILITYTCVLTNESVTVPCADTITMPCCKCNYCADSMKISSQSSGISYNNSNNLAQINQSFSVTPNNITHVTAEIVYMSDSVNDPACNICDAKPESVYHFTGTSTMSWNGNTPLNASAANSATSFPSKIISWQCNNNGNVSFILNAGLPDIPKLKCCETYTRICIRYSFTDANCKKCDILVCYSLSYSTGSGTTEENGTGNTKN